MTARRHVQTSTSQISRHLANLFASGLALAAFVACGAGSQADGADGTNGASDASSTVGSASADATSRGAPARERSAMVLDAASAPGFGTGFVVWESNRDGRWRLWRRDFDGSAPRPITPDEPRSAHCCAHIAPGGTRLVYLALPADQASYPRSGAAGELRLLDFGVDPGRDGLPPSQIVWRGARTYFEHRAAVWRDHRTLIFIDGEGRTRSLAAGQEEPELLTTRPLDASGWLFDPTLSFATQGTPTFSPYDAAQRAVREQPTLGGCQPYFGPEGRLGVWVAGAGGPIRALDLRSRRQWPILAKGDGRLPADRAYLYFPMPSRDGRFFAWGASDGAHDHTRADYDVFVAESDPETLELIGPAWRVTQHQGTDRFPDVWSAPLALGRHVGEAPFTARLEAPDPTFRWDLGDGQTATGATVRHTWASAGRYEVVARSSDGGRALRGTVQVEPGAPPKVLSAELRRGGRELWVRFDEPIDVRDAELRIEGGPAVVSSRLEDRDTAWVLDLEKNLARPMPATLRGVADKAQTPHRLEQDRFMVVPARWPSRRDGLVLLWQSAEHANRVVDPRSGREETTVFERLGRAWFDRNGAAVFRGGFLEADMGTMERLLHGLQATNELTLEATFTAASADTPQPAALFGFASGNRQRNLTLAQEGDRLTLRIRTPESGPGADRPVVDLGPVRAGKAQHAVVTYTPGRLRAFVDGELTLDTEAVREGFFHWQPRHLRLGAEGPWGSKDQTVGSWPWRGTLEGVAVYDRALGADEARENHQRSADLLAERERLDGPRVVAALRVRSRTPSLEEIAPYDEALAVFEYEVRRVLAGVPKADVLYVVHRVLLDGEILPVAQMRRDTEVELTLEPFGAQTQLESLYLSDDLRDARAGGGTLWWSARIEP